MISTNTDETLPGDLMERNTVKLIRTSIYIYLKYFHYFTTTPALLLIPFSASILLSHGVFQSSLLSFHALRISPHVNQAIFSYVFCLQFALSFFIIAKLYIIQALNNPHKPSLLLPFASCRSFYKPLFLTQLCNLVFIKLVNISALLINFLACNSFKAFGVSINNNPIFSLLSSSVFYTVIANASVLCNMALVVAAMENCCGHKAILRAYKLQRGKNSMVLLLALPTNSGLAIIESLFRYRVLRAYHLIGRPDASLAMEGLLIAYMYSLILVLETVICCLFVKSCEPSFGAEQPADSNCHSIQLDVKEEQQQGVQTAQFGSV